MTTEAQRLMMMSLGKIHGCRQQRGGINLHKSLMVTKVLYRARSAALNENSPRKERWSTDDQKVPDIDVKTDEPLSDQASRENHAVEHEAMGNTDYSESEADTIQKGSFQDTSLEDKENTKPQSLMNQNYQVRKVEDFSESKQDKALEKNNDRSSRCVKRRLTEVEAAVDSIIPKKQRTDSESLNNSEAEPMQVETTQISNLVNCFSSGFTGLLNTDSNCQHTHEEPSDLSPSRASDSLLSCSTHIKESFELLARPIALSV